MDQQYDDTNRGVFFMPKSNNEFVGQGKVNFNGNENYHVMIKATLPSGTVIRELYKKVGVLHENKNENPNAPHLSGDYEDKRIAAWTNISKNNVNYISVEISEKKETESNQFVSNGPNEYEQVKNGTKSLDQVVNNVISDKGEPDLVDEIPF